MWENVFTVVQRKEMDIMAGLFNKIGRARRIPKKLAQYDDEYLLYCVEKDRVETVLFSFAAGGNRMVDVLY